MSAIARYVCTESNIYMYLYNFLFLSCSSSSSSYFFSSFFSGYEHDSCYWSAFSWWRDHILVSIYLVYSDVTSHVTSCDIMYHSRITHRFMVTIIEKLMPKNYYTCGLAAAQADQVWHFPVGLFCLSVCLSLPPETFHTCCCNVLKFPPFVF